MSRPGPGVLALVGLAGVLLGVGVWRVVAVATDSRSADRRSGTTTGDDVAPPLGAALAATQPATDPFPGLTQTDVRVGERGVHIVIADDSEERSEGLRRRRDLGPYAGMLFVFPDDTTTAFTMSTVPVALDIGFYDAAGRVVDHLRMGPCAGSDAECPLYQARAPFRFALETLAGGLPAGRLS